MNEPMSNHFILSLKAFTSLRSLAGRHGAVMRSVLGMDVHMGALRPLDMLERLWEPCGRLTSAGIASETGSLCSHYAHI
jgi:hypothetical protein